MPDQAPLLGIERHASDPIPEAERTRHVRSLLTLWFSANMQLTPIVTGAFAVILGLSIPWAALAAVIGTLVGTLFMAYHSAQGPKLGVPQMIQSRAQFGYIGASLPLLMALTIYIGYLALTGVLGAQAFAAWTHSTLTEGLLAVSFVCLALAIYGYKWIHRYERWMSGLFIIAFAYLSVRLLTKYSISAAISHGPGGHSPAIFVLAVAAIASYVVTWAPYVSDYSRYLPKETSISSTFWYTYAGTVVSTIWMELLGVVAAGVALKAFDADPAAFLGSLAGGGLNGAILVIIILGVIAANVMNLYSAYMTTSASLDWVIDREREEHALVRVCMVSVLAIVGFVFGVAAEGNFYSSLSNFLLLILYAVIPWTAINLTDFYLIKHGQYDVDAMYDIRGRYGLVRWNAVVIFLVAGLIEVPFMNTTLYEGPIAKALGGADIAWLVGFAVAAVAYYVWERASGTQPAPAVRTTRPFRGSRA